MIGVIPHRSMSSCPFEESLYDFDMHWQRAYSLAEDPVKSVLSCPDNPDVQLSGRNGRMAQKSYLRIGPVTMKSDLLFLTVVFYLIKKHRSAKKMLR